MNSLSASENALAGVTSLLQDVKDIVVAAGNAAQSDRERAYQASELRGRLADMLGFANSRDAVGDYLFSGFQTDTAAFAETAPGVFSYQGDAGQRMIQVDAARQIAVTVTGDAVFQVGFEHPDWYFGFDTDAETAQKNRKALIEQAATDKVKLLGYHWAYPGVGFAERKGNAFAFVAA